MTLFNKLLNIPLLLMIFSNPLQAIENLEDPLTPPCEMLRISNKQFCFSSTNFYKDRTPVLVVLNETEPNDLNLQVFAYSINAEKKLTVNKLFEEEGVGIKLKKTFNENGEHSYILQDLNTDGQVDLAFSVEVYPRHQLVLLSYDQKSNSFGFLTFNDPNPKVGKDDTFDFNFTSPGQSAFPFISREGVIKLPVNCSEKFHDNSPPKCLVEEYKSLKKGTITVTKSMQ